MKTITFDTVIEEVVNNRSFSRKEKLISIQRFLKENSGKKNNPLPEELAVIEKLKTVRQTYLLKEKEEKEEKSKPNAY